MTCSIRQVILAFMGPSVLKTERLALCLSLIMATPGWWGSIAFHCRNITGRSQWGGAPKGESAENCALRELREESGLIAESLTPIGRVHLSNCITDEEGLLFVAKGLTEGPSDTEETEVLTVRRLPFEEAFQMAQDGRITDVLSVLAITRIRLAGIA